MLKTALLQPSCHLSHFRRNLLRLHNTDFPAKSKDPGEKGRAGGNIHGGLEVRPVYDLRLHLLSEAVYNAAHGAVLAQQCYPLDVGSEHPEHLVDIRRGIEVLRWYGLLHQQLHSGHAVYTELGQLAVFLRPAHGVVIVPAPDQGIGAELVPISCAQRRGKRSRANPQERLQHLAAGTAGAAAPQGAGYGAVTDGRRDS